MQSLATQYPDPHLCEKDQHKYVVSFGEELATKEDLDTIISDYMNMSHSFHWHKYHMISSSPPTNL